MNAKIMQLTALLSPLIIGSCSTTPLSEGRSAVIDSSERSLPNDFKIERTLTGDFVIFSKEKNVLIGYLKNDPKTGPSCSIDINGGPILSYYGLGSSDKSRRYTEFYTKKSGFSEFIYDRNLDGFPDEGLTHDGKYQKLQVWVVDDNGKLLRRKN